MIMGGAVCVVLLVIPVVAAVAARTGGMPPVAAASPSDTQPPVAQATESQPTPPQPSPTTFDQLYLLRLGSVGKVRRGRPARRLHPEPEQRQHQPGRVRAGCPQYLAYSSGRRAGSVARRARRAQRGETRHLRDDQLRHRGLLLERGRNGQIVANNFNHRFEG